MTTAFPLEPTTSPQSPGLQANFTRRFTGGPTIQVHQLRICQSETVTVFFGPSGSGKTTILRCIAGLDQPNEGTLNFSGETWFAAAPYQFLPPQRRRIGFVPQNYGLFPHLSVERNIAYSLHALPAAQRQSRVAETIARLGLNGLEKRFPREISGGQQQRVALARAIVSQPRLLLLDEPLSAVDAPTRSQLRSELRRILRELRIPAIVVTHDRAEAMALGDELVAIADGRILQQGRPQDVFNRPNSLAAADAMAVETVQPGKITHLSDGLASVAVNQIQLTAIAGSMTSGTEVFVCIRAEDVILIEGSSARSSARNRLPAAIKSIRPEGAMVRIDLDCGFPLTALLTRQACDEMELKETDSVTALIKTPNVHLIAHTFPDTH